MKKLIIAVLVLFILTVFVSGASAHSDRTTKFTVGVSQYADAYATSNSADEAYADSVTYAAAGVSDTKKGKAGFAIGSTQAYVDGGSGSQVGTGQTVSGTLF